MATFEEKDEDNVKFMTHQMWCEWWIYDDTEVCDCGYREDLLYDEDAERLLP